MSQYQQDIDNFATLKAAQNGTWEGINPEFAARMKVQNRFKTGLTLLATLQVLCAKTWLNMTQIRLSTHSHQLLAWLRRPTKNAFS